MTKLKHPQILTGLAILSTMMPMKANAQTVAAEAIEGHVCGTDTLVWSHPIHSEHRMKQYGGFGYDGFASGIVDCYWSGGKKDQDFDKLNPGKWKTLCDNLRNNSPAVRRLPLNGYNFTTNQTDELLDALHENRSVEYLDLKYTSLRPVDMGRLLFAVKNNPNLKGLDLSGNLMLGYNVEQIGAFLRESKTLESLFLGSPYAYPPKPLMAEQKFVDREFIKPLADALRENNTLKCLSLQGWMMTLDAAEELFNALKKNKSIEVLDLQEAFSNQDKTAPLMADFLASNPKLKEMSLSGCGFPGGTGAKIAKALERNTHLEVLYAINNNFGPQDYRAIAKMLGKNETLHEIHSNGDFDDESVILLANSIGKNFTLTSADFIDHGKMPSRTIQAINFAEGFNRKFQMALRDPNATTLPYMNADIVDEYGSAMQKLVFDNFVPIKSYLKDNPDKKLSDYLEANFGISRSPAVKQRGTSR